MLAVLRKVDLAAQFEQPTQEPKIRPKLDEHCKKRVWSGTIGY